MRRIEQALKLFAISNQLTENDLDRIEREFAVDLGRQHVASFEKDETYYPQIDRSICQEAASRRGRSFAARNRFGDDAWLRRSTRLHDVRGAQ